ncbi:hypothetical protein CPX_001829, partial [Candidatus Phytoplasma pruni]
FSKEQFSFYFWVYPSIRIYKKRRMLNKNDLHMIIKNGYWLNLIIKLLTKFIKIISTKKS